MGGFLAELGKKLAERWLSLLVLPGLLYLAVLIAASLLGHRHPFAFGRLTSRLEDWTSTPGLNSVSGLVLVLLATLLAAAGAGLAAQALGSVTEQAWLAERWQSWPPPLRRLATSHTISRTRRWTAATETYDQQVDIARAHLAGRTGTPPETDLGQARRSVTRIAQEKPARPTWIGDRIHAVIVRLDREYDLDLATVWPSLWLTLPEPTRTEITTARQALTRATVLAGWGLLYLAVAALWWPGLFLATTTIITAWRRARTAADTYALLIEAATRLHTPNLARALGLDHTGRLTQQTGWALTCLLQGRSNLVPLTTGWPTRVNDG